MQFLDAAWTVVLDHLHGAFSLGSPYGPAALGGALLFTVLFYVDARQKRRSKISVSGFFKSVFPKRIVWHPSSRLDMRLWAINTLLLTSSYGMVAIGSFLWRNAVLAGLTALLGPHDPTVWPVWTILALATLLHLLAFEFGYWISHYTFHAIPALWEFHKVHHSAEVLTTLTEMRQHPIEIIAFSNVIALLTGSVFGIMTYAFGHGVQPYTLLNANIVLMAFLLTIGHLRHSHMWIPFKGLAGRLFQSPAHHQIHHSNQPRHFNKNLGFALAVWDWLFGTLYVPEKYERITFGVGAEHVDFSTVLKSFALPFVRSGEHLSNAFTRLVSRTWGAVGERRSGAASSKG